MATKEGPSLRGSLRVGKSSPAIAVSEAYLLSALKVTFLGPRFERFHVHIWQQIKSEFGASRGFPQGGKKIATRRASQAA